MARSIWIRRITVCLCVSAVVVACASQRVDAQQPQPDPAVKKLEAWVGKWNYSGELQPSPLGPQGKFNGELTREFVLNGFFLQEQWQDKTGSYVSQGIIVTGYEAASKRFVQIAFENDGSVSHGAVSIEGNTFESKLSRKDKSGKPYLVKLTIRLSDAGAPVEEKAEYSSDDGKSWQPYFDLKFHKAE